MGDFVKAVLDPAGVLGNWEDTPGSPPPPPMRMSNDPHHLLGLGRYNTMMGGIDANNERLADLKRTQGYMQGLGASVSPGVEAMKGAWNPDLKVKPADWSAQWSYTPGKGPQWIEPERVSPNNDVPWATKVNNGPAKGNRF